MSITPNKVIVQVSFPQSGNAAFKTVAFPLNLTAEEARNISAAKGGIQEDKSKYGLYLPEEDIWMKENDKIEHYKLKDRVKIECKLRPVDMLVIIEEDSKMIPIDFSKTVATLLGIICEKFGEKVSDCNLLLEGNDSKTTTLSDQKTLFEYHPPPGSKLILKRKTKIGAIFRRSDSINKTKTLRNASFHHEESSNSTRIFGAPLESVCDENYGGVPAVVAKTIEYIEKEGLKLEGIFRISGNQVEIQNMKKAFDSGNDVNIRSCSSPHIASGLMKLYFRELPEPLFTFSLYEVFLGIFTSCKNVEARIKYFKIIIDTLPKANHVLLLRLLPFLAEVVKYEDINKMAIHNVATVFGPNLLKSQDDSAIVIIQDTAVINGVTCDIVKNYDFLIKEYFHDFKAYGKTLYAYTKNSEMELSFNLSDFVFITKEEEAGWLEGEINGVRGFIPANYVQIIGKFKPQSPSSSSSSSSSSANRNNNNNQSGASAGANQMDMKKMAVAAAAKATSRSGDDGMSRKQFLNELNDLKQLVQKQQNTRMQLESIVAQLTSQLQSLSPSIQNNNSSSSNNSIDASDSLNSSFISLKNEHLKLKNEFDQLTKTGKTIQQNIDEISTVMMRFNREINELTDDKMNMQREIESLSEKITAIKDNNFKAEDIQNASNNNQNNSANSSGSSTSTSRREPPTRRIIPLKRPNN